MNSKDSDHRPIVAETIEGASGLITFNIHTVKSLKSWLPDREAVMSLARRWAERRPATAHDAQKHLEDGACE